MQTVHHHRGVQLVAPLAVALALALLAAAPAAPAPPQRTPIDFSREFVIDDFCGETGLSVDAVGVVTGWFTWRDGGRGRLPYFAEHSVLTETHAANGVTTTYVERTFDKDLSVVDKGATIEVTVIATGNATLYGPDGKAVARNPGQFRYRLTFDAVTGDEIGFEPLLGSTGRTDDFCAVEIPLLSP